ncbi:hypothetical protein J2X46_000025 [Nocardioides sp. BE266]|uniref:hypothetical protein n=1 Tax=Nocardioides sp. BE266 TaxID=2817725 RepID=UPI002864E953|nr:hypothetical protein [Nocardioides sp. BE266]MDR7251053.1 hypothetical protein [Nocardioides sp. BE266]
MTKQAVPPARRRRAWRTTFLTGAVLLLSLSVSPGARADEGDGLLGGVAEVVGGVTDPVVEPAVEVAHSAVPQPVQQAAAPVVEQVVQPVVSHAEQAVAPVPGADRVTQPVVKAAESVVRPAGRPREQGGSGTGEPTAGTHATPSATPADGPVSTGAAQDSSTSDGTRHGDGPSGFAPCDGLSDLPPRGTATPGSAREPGQAAVIASSSDVEVLAAESDADDRSGRSDPRPRQAPLTDVPWFDSTGSGLGARGGSITVPVLSGLVGLVGMLLLGVALVRSRQHA